MRKLNPRILLIVFLATVLVGAWTPMLKAGARNERKNKLNSLEQTFTGKQEQASNSKIALESTQQSKRRLVAVNGETAFMESTLTGGSSTTDTRLDLAGERWALSQDEQKGILRKCTNVLGAFNRTDLIGRWEHASIEDAFLEYNVFLEEIQWLASVSSDGDCIGIIAFEKNGDLAWLNPNTRISLLSSFSETNSRITRCADASVTARMRLITFGGVHYWLSSFDSTTYLVNVFSLEVAESTLGSLQKAATEDTAPAPMAHGNTEIQPDTVPWFDQGARSWCCPYSTTMVLAWWGFPAALNSHDQCAYEIARIGQGQDPPNVNDGVYVGCAARAADQLTDFETIWHGEMRSIWSCDDSTPYYIDDLKDNIYRDGSIVAIEVDCDGSSATTNDLHISVIIGYDDTAQFVNVHDPSGAWTGWGGDTFASYSNLESRWGAWDGNWPFAGFPDKDAPTDWFPHWHRHLGMVLCPGDRVLSNPSCALTPPPSTIRYGDTITLTASLSCSGQSAGYSGIHIRISGGSIVGYSTTSFTSYPYDTSANPSSLPAPIIEFERSSITVGTTYTASVTIQPSVSGSMYIYYRGWATDTNDRVHCNYDFAQVNPWQTQHHTTTVNDDSTASPISMPSVEGSVQRDPASWSDDRWCGSYKFTWYACKSYSVAVTASSILITEALNPSTSSPSAPIEVYGAATFNDGSAVSYEDVTITITQTGASWTTATDASGHYSRYISAPATAGVYAVRVDISSDGLSGWNSQTLTVQNFPGGNYYTLHRTTTCKNVQPSSPYDPIDETESFRASDSTEWTWVHLTYVYRSLNIRWEWYRPDGSYYTSSTYTVPDPASSGYLYWEYAKCWGGIYISGYAPADTEGKWTSKIFIDEGSGYQLKAEEPFVIRYEVTSRTTAKDVQTSSPYEPIDPTSSFLNTDPRAYGWIRLDEVAEGLDIRWDWYEPSGALYSTFYWTTEDPSGSGYLYWDWYKAWCNIDIYGYAPQSKIGTWEVRAYIKDVYGNWDLEYSQYFTISDNTPPGVPGAPTDGGAYSITGTVTWAWTAAPEDWIVTQYQVQIGTAPNANDVFEGLVGTELSKTISGLPNGFTYYARVRAMNSAGQWGLWSSASDGITVDTAPPLTTIFHTPGSASISLSAVDATSGVSVTYYRIDSGAWMPYSGAITLTGNESHLIEYYSRDNAGNSESIHALIVHYLEVDTDPSGLDAPSGEGWYDFGTNAPISVSAVPDYEFRFWYLDGEEGSVYSSSMSTEISMETSHIATAKFSYFGVINLNTGLRYSKIQLAINEANSGDTIYVEAGTYYERLIVDKSLSFIGENKDNTIVDAQWTGDYSDSENVFNIWSNDVSINGFTIQNGFRGIKVWANGSVIFSNIMKSNCIGIFLGDSFYGYHSYNNTIDANAVMYTSFYAIISVGGFDRITQNLVLNNGHGIQSSVNNYIVGNTIIDVSGGYGIYPGSNSYIANNTITHTRHGIYIDSMNNFVTNNNVSNNIYDGITLWDANNNTITRNTISQNGWSGIAIHYSDGTHVFHNNFIDNGNPPVAQEGADNSWDDGYSSGGNYWSDYSGIDANGDGIGDTPYIIDVSNRDNYPLMIPYPYIPSDINRDGIVDILDLGALGNAYGSSLGDPNWNPGADICNNMIVDVRDLHTLGKNYGKTSGTTEMSTIAKPPSAMILPGLMVLPMQVVVYGRRKAHAITSRHAEPN